MPFRSWWLWVKSDFWVFCCETEADTCWTSDTNHICFQFGPELVKVSVLKINPSRVRESLVLQFLTVTPDQLSRPFKGPYWSCERQQNEALWCLTGEWNSTCMVTQQLWEEECTCLCKLCHVKSYSRHWIVCVEKVWHFPLHSFPLLCRLCAVASLSFPIHLKLLSLLCSLSQLSAADVHSHKDLSSAFPLE